MLPGGVAAACVYLAPPLVIATAALLANLGSATNVLAFGSVLLIGAVGHALGLLVRVGNLMRFI